MAVKILGSLGVAPYGMTVCEINGEPVVNYQYKNGENIISSPYSIITIIHYLYKYNYELVKDGVELYILSTDAARNLHYNKECKHVIINQKKKPGFIPNDYCLIENNNELFLQSNYLNLYHQIKYYNETNLLGFQIKPHFIEVPEDINHIETWKLFYKHKELINKNDKIILDITFGFRNQPQILSFSTIFQESLFQDDLVQYVFYVKVKNFTSNKGHLVDLMKMYTISKWADAVSTFIQTGYYKPVNLLIKQTYFDYEITYEMYKTLNSISETLSVVSDGLLDVKTGFYIDVYNETTLNQYITYNLLLLKKKINDFKNKYHKHSIFENELGLIFDVLNQIEEKFSWIELQHENTGDALSYQEINTLNHHYYDHLLMIMNYYYENRLYEQLIKLVNGLLTDKILYKDKFQTIQLKSDGNKIKEYFIEYYKQLEILLNENNYDQFSEMFKYLNQLTHYKNNLMNISFINFHDMKINKTITDTDIESHLAILFKKYKKELNLLFSYMTKAHHISLKLFNENIIKDLIE